MTRTPALVTAARAKGVELPGEWFGKRQSCPNCKSDNLRSVFNSPTYRCRLCGSKWLDKHLERDGAEFFCGPDLTLPKNLHHAFRFADALNGKPVSIVFDGYGSDAFCVVADHIGTAPERHLALVAACEAALGIERREEGV